MSETKKLLAALDFSPYTEETLKTAAEIAQCMNAELVVVNVIHQKDLDSLKFIESTTGMISAQEYEDKMLAERKEKMNKLVLSLGVSATQMVRMGVPWEEILAACDESEADVLVVGTKGRSDLERTLFGSNAEKVYRHSPVTVISVRGDHHQAQLKRLRNT